MVYIVENKKQHYVPQFFLRQFSWNDKHLYAYNVKTKKSYCVSISDVCKGKYFYSDDPEDEKNLAAIESEQAVILKKLSETKDVRSIDNFKELFYFQLFLTLQISRTKEAKESMERWFESQMKNYYVPLMKQSQIFKDVPEDYLNDLHKKVKWLGGFDMKMLSGFYGPIMISDLRPFFLLNQTKKNFICSDTPVVRNNYIKNGELCMMGYQSTGLQIICPLNKKTALLLVDYNTYKINYHDNQFIDITNDSDIDEINRLQVVNCSNLVFYSENNDESYVSSLHSKYEKDIEKEVKPIIIQKKMNLDGTISIFEATNFDRIYNNSTFSFIILGDIDKSGLKVYRSQKIIDTVIEMIKEDLKIARNNLLETHRQG